jgi:hypothetical protein
MMSFSRTPSFPHRLLSSTSFYSFVPGIGAAATVGYIPENWPIRTPREGRHRILINSGAKDLYSSDELWVASQMHDFGMSDRANWVMASTNLLQNTSWVYGMNTWGKHPLGML